MKPVAPAWVPTGHLITDHLNEHIHDGSFQRSLALVAGFSGLMSGAEVTLEHYRGSYGQRIMYSPVILSAFLGASGVGAALRPRWARTWLPLASWALILDGVIGFGFHIRGIQRKPGGWRLPVTNIVMGPPIFAPLLLPVGGVLGLIASRLSPSSGAAMIRSEKFQRLLCSVTAASALLNGFEALYSHYKSGFRRRSQWIPIVLAPAITALATAAIYKPRAARTALPAVSMLALGAGVLGSILHARAAMKRPGFRQLKFYTIAYGPPVLAPLLFSATGFMGLLASGLRREG